MSASSSSSFAGKVVRTLPVLVLAGCLGSALTSGGSGGSAGSGGGNGGGNNDGSASTPSDGGVGGNGGGADMTAPYVTAFYANVAPILNSACAGCHGVAGGAGPAFMMPMPNELNNLLAYPTIIGSTPESSQLYMKGAHEGPALTPTQAMTIHDWITLYDATLPEDGGTSKPQIKPFAPNFTANNSIDLSVLDPTLAGQKLTFDAAMVGTSIELKNITVVAAPAMGIHIGHPVFVIWNQMLTPTPDPVDSFSNVDETVSDGATAPLGPGTLIMPNFPTGGLVNVVFTTIEAKNLTADGGATTGCKSVATFATDVVPQINGSNAGNVSLNCTSCHGAQGNTAANVWNIVGLSTTAASDTAQCASSLGEINTTTPAMSNLFKKVDPNSGVAHQGGKLAAGQITNFETAITTWINAEK